MPAVEEDLGVGQRHEQRLERGPELGRQRRDAGEGAADALAQPAALGAEGLPVEPGRAGWVIGGGTSRDGGAVAVATAGMRRRASRRRASRRRLARGRGSGRASGRGV